MFIIGGPIFGLIGLLILKYKYKPFREWQLIKNTPTQNTDTVAVGRCNLHGEVRKTEDADPILKGTDYSYATVRVEKKSNDNWQTVDIETFESEMRLKDKHGEVLLERPNESIKEETGKEPEVNGFKVKQSGAAVENRVIHYILYRGQGGKTGKVYTSGRESHRPDSKEGLPEIIQEYLEANEIEFDTDKRYSLYKIDDNEECYVHGEFEGDSIGVDNSVGIYVIGNKNEDEMIKTAKFVWKSSLLLGLSFSAFGIVSTTVGLSRWGII